MSLWKAEKNVTSEALRMVATTLYLKELHIPVSAVPNLVATSGLSNDQAGLGRSRPSPTARPASLSQHHVLFFTMLFAFFLSIALWQRSLARFVVNFSKKLAPFFLRVGDWVTSVRPLFYPLVRRSSLILAVIFFDSSACCLTSRLIVFSTALPVTGVLFCLLAKRQLGLTVRRQMFSTLKDHF